MYIAHKRDNGQTQPIKAHLEGVSQTSGGFAAEFGAQQLGELIGLAHDIGKYTVAFQKRIREGARRVDHSTAGAQELWRVLLRSRAAATAAYCVMAHHTGLPDGGSIAEQSDAADFYMRLKKNLDREFLGDYTGYKDDVSLSSAALPALYPAMGPGFCLSFLIRMLFSCLVDADYLETERFLYDGIEQRGSDPIRVLHERMLMHVQPLLQQAPIFRTCLQQAENKSGLFTLAVPAGGGKTLASLAFALQHASTRGMRRIFYILPDTFMVEQTASVFTKIFGRVNVLEQYYDISYDNDEGKPSPQYLTAENWDTPIVLTTTTQFFEALFAAHPAACRKLHNIANSVILFDELQMLPFGYLLPCVNAIAELIKNYRCTAILCGSAQYALAPYFPSDLQSTAICDEQTTQGGALGRLDIRQLGDIPDNLLIEHMLARKQALCIVNNNRHAQALYRMLPGDGNFCLSAAMYPQHRQRLLRMIRARLQQDLPCRVISTGIIQAETDLFFPTIYRAQAGLDSILQVAGRCGRQGHPCPTYVFEPNSQYPSPRTLKQPMRAYREVLKQYPHTIASEQAVLTYFQTLFSANGQSPDEKDILPRLEQMARECSFPFRSIDADFLLTDEQTFPVLIDVEQAAQMLYRALRGGAHSRELLREAGRYCITLPASDWERLHRLGVISPLDNNCRLSVLVKHGYYDSHTGLQLDA